MAKIRQETGQTAKDRMQELLRANLTKAMEASKELGEVQAAYIAGQIDGMLNGRMLSDRQSA